MTGWALAPSLAVCGFGLGLAMTPFFDITLAGVTLPLVGSASGVLNANQQLGGTVGVAVLGTVFFGLFDAGHPTGAMAAVLAASAVLVLAAGALAFRLPRARDAERARSRSWRASAPTRRASPIVSTLSDGRRRSSASRRSATGPRTATSPLACPCSHAMPLTGAADEPLPRGPEPVVGGVQVQRGAVGERRLSAGSDGRSSSRPSYSETPSAARSAGTTKSAPRASAASARCTSTSCSRLRIHQDAGRGPLNVHTGVSGPDLGHGVEDRLRPALEPVDQSALRRSPVGHLPGIGGQAGSHDRGRPPIAPADVPEQLLERPTRAGGHRRLRVGRRGEGGEVRVLVDEGGGMIHGCRPYRANAPTHDSFGDRVGTAHGV